jgi:hypothetical protein
MASNYGLLSGWEFSSTFQEQGHLKGYADPGSLFPVTCPQQIPEYKGLMFFLVDG